MALHCTTVVQSTVQFCLLQTICPFYCLQHCFAFFSDYRQTSIFSTLNLIFSTPMCALPKTAHAPVLNKMLLPGPFFFLY